MSCAVKGCKNYNWKTRNMPGRKVQYFSFPKDNAMVLKWLEVCKKQDLSIAKAKTARICSVHFEPSCFEKSLQQKLLQYSPKRVRKIRKDAIPTLHLFHNLQEKNTPLFHQLPERMDVSLDVESGSDAMTNTSMSSIVKYEEEIDDVIAPADVMDASLNANKAPDGMTNLPISTMHKADQDITALIYVNDSSEVIDAVPANVMDSSSTADTQKLQKKLAALKEKCKMYTEKDKLHRKTIQMLHVKMKKMIKCFKVSLAEEKDKYEAKMYDVLKIVFSPGQIKMLLNPSERKRIVWSSENIASAMELRCVSSKAYRYLRNVQKIPLPSLSTLRKCATSNKKKIGKESFP